MSAEALRALAIVDHRGVDAARLPPAPARLRDGPLAVALTPAPHRALHVGRR